METTGKKRNRNDERKLLGDPDLLNKGTISGKARSWQQYERDLHTEAALYLQGKNFSQILEVVNKENEGISPYPIQYEQIKYDLAEIHKRWINSSLLDFNERKAKELAALDNLEATYWKVYERSLENKTTEFEQRIEDEIAFAMEQVVPVVRSKKYTRTEKGLGSEWALKGVAECIDKRCKVLGLYSPQEYRVDWRVEAVKAGISREAALAQFERMVQGFQEAIENGAINADGSKVNDVVDAEYRDDD